MKILLFRIFKENRYSIIPLIASLERSNIIKNLKIIVLKEKVNNKVLSDLDSKKVLIAYSFMSHQAKRVYEEWKLLKSNLKDLMIIAGGPHVSAMSKEAIEHGADIVCCFDGEEVFKEIVEDFIHNEFRASKKVLSKKFLGWEEEFPFSKNPMFVSPIEITRGCPYGCKYCQTPMLKGKKVRHKILDVIVESVKFLVKFGITDIRFISPNALGYGSCDGKTLNLEKVETLLYRIKSVLPKDGRIFFGSFPSEVRQEFLNEDSVKLIKRYCANKRIVFGAQTGSPDMLKKMGRGHSIEDVIKATDVLLKHNIEPVIDFIIGLPEESEDDLKLTLDLMERLTNTKAKVHLHYFMPLPGTAWAKKKPTPIPNWALNKINKLISKGNLFGQWIHQVNIAKELCDETKEV